METLPDASEKAHLHIVVSRETKAAMASLAIRQKTTISQLVERAYKAYEVFIKPGIDEINGRKENKT